MSELEMPDIPAFLHVDDAEQKRRNEYNRTHPPQFGSTRGDYAAQERELRLAREQARQEGSMGFMPQSEFDKMKARAIKEGATPEKFDAMRAGLQPLEDTTGKRWCPVRVRWVPDLDHGGPSYCLPSTPIDEDSPEAKRARRTDANKEEQEKAPRAKSSGPKDDLAEQVKAATSTDGAVDLVKLKKFAKTNGVWDDKYDDLPNNGLKRMNVVNRLRGKAKKDPKFKVMGL